MHGIDLHFNKTTNEDDETALEMTLVDQERCFTQHWEFPLSAVKQTDFPEWVGNEICLWLSALYDTDMEGK